jgi:hypothetical protein
MPAPEGGFPRFDGYDVVSVRVREATITARNRGEGEAFDEYVALPPPPVPVQVQQQPVFKQPVYQQQMYTPGMVMPSPTPSPAKAARKQRVLGRDVAIWICVAQLGVIIWCLLGPMMQQKNTVLLKAASNWQGEVGRAFNSAKANVIAHVSHVAPVKKPPKGGKKPFAHKGFVPPPPPELVSNSRMMVPPPPVAYRLPMAGAAAASTLPVPPSAGAIRHETVIAHEPEEVLTPNTVPSYVPSRAPLAPPPLVAAEEREPGTDPASEATPLPVPDWLQQVPTYNWHEAMNEPTAAAPVPSRKVMNGNRTRIITDR